MSSASPQANNLPECDAASSSIIISILPNRANLNLFIEHNDYQILSAITKSDIHTHVVVVSLCYSRTQLFILGCKWLSPYLCSGCGRSHPSSFS